MEQEQRTSATRPPASPDRWLEHAYRTIRSEGARVGAARSAVLEFLADRGGCLLTPQAIIDVVVHERRAGSPSSVYRSLEEFERLGLVRRVAGPGSVAQFEVDQPGEHHHHFIDVASGRVVPFRDAELDRLVEAIADRLGVRLRGYDVLLTGDRRTAGGAGAAP